MADIKSDTPRQTPEPKPAFDISSKAASLLRSFIPWMVWGCLVPAGSLLVIAIALAVFLHFHRPQLQPPKFIKDAEPKIEERQKEIAEAQKLPVSYDVDSTISALFSMEQVLAKAKNFEELTSYIVQRDSGLVAPDVLALKCRFFDIYSRLLQSKDELQDMDSMYGTIGGALLDVASISDL